MKQTEAGSKVCRHRVLLVVVSPKDTKYKTTLEAHWRSSAILAEVRDMTGLS